MNGALLPLRTKEAQLKQVNEGGWVAVVAPTGFDPVFDLTTQWQTKEGAVLHGREHLKTMSDDDVAPDEFWVGQVCFGDPTFNGGSAFSPVFINEMEKVTQ
jgi:hypothetical protein